MDIKLDFLQKTRTFVSDPKLFNGSVYREDLAPSLLIQWLGGLCRAVMCIAPWGGMGTHVCLRL